MNDKLQLNRPRSPMFYFTVVALTLITLAILANLGD